MQAPRSQLLALGTSPRWVILIMQSNMDCPKKVGSQISGLLTRSTLKNLLLFFLKAQILILHTIHLILRFSYVLIAAHCVPSSSLLFPIKPFLPISRYKSWLFTISKKLEYLQAINLSLSHLQMSFHTTLRGF